MVFFGYTNCPDICRAVMANLASALTRLDEADRDDVEVVFVTTDPARDTAPVLRSYLDALRHLVHRRHRGDRRDRRGGPLDRRRDGGASCRAAATRSARTRPRSPASTRPTRRRSTGTRTRRPRSSPRTSTPCWEARHDCLVDPQPLDRRSGTSARCRCAATRWRSSSGSSRRSGSPSGAGWPAAAGPGDIQDLAVWAVIFGLVGARLYHVLTDSDRYFGANGSLWEIVYVWRGGLGVWGGIALGAVGVMIGAKLKGIRFWPVLDVMAPSVAGRPGDRPLGQLVQPGAVRPADRPAVGPGDRRRPPAARLRGLRDLPPDVPLRVPVEPGRVRRPDLARPPLPLRARTDAGRST